MFSCFQSATTSLNATKSYTVDLKTSLVAMDINKFLDLDSAIHIRVFFSRPEQNSYWEFVCNIKPQYVDK